MLTNFPRSLRLALALASAVALQTSVRADDAATNKPAASAPDTAEMMKKWAEIAAPGPSHKKLEAVVGTWDVESKFWMGGPNDAPMESKGKSTKRWILGNRFVQEEFKGEMFGAPFEGLGIVGYDNFKKKYVNVWLDTSGSAISTGEGGVEGDVITLNGVMDEPLTGEKNKPVKYVLRISSPEKHTLEIHDVNLGDKSRVGEIIYTKKKA